MGEFTRVSILLLLVLAPSVATAGPAEDANAAVDSWSAAYSSNEPEAVAKTIGRTRFFSELSVPLCPRGLRQSELISRP